MSYHFSRAMRAMVSSYSGLIDLQAAQLLLPAHVVPVGDDVVDQPVAGHTEQEQVRYLVVAASAGDNAEVLGLPPADADLRRDIAVSVSAEAGHGVGQIGECVNQSCPDHLADGAHLAFAVQHSLAAPYLERHVAEAGALRAQVNHALDIVRPVGVKERADHRLSAVFARCRAGARPECLGS